jgi:hypothetical protein
MPRGNFELPPEAQELIQRVEELPELADRHRARLEQELAGIRKRGEREVEELAREIKRKRAEFEAELKAARSRLDEDRVAFEEMRQSHARVGSVLAQAWADYEHARAEAIAQELESKTHPAPTAAHAVREKGQRLAEMRRRAKLAEFIVELYEWHFPWLVELRDAQEGEAYLEAPASGGGDRPGDPAGRWLSKDEWQALEPAERNQRALERYLKSRKSPWQLGRDYERYIGYLRERAGCTVTYQGIAKGLEDLGRDVLAERDGTLEVIQCKRWAQRKTIHEKHVFQLYGTVVLARLERPGQQVTGTFTTTTSLSEKAKEVANYLEIKIEERVSLADYPRIKCNIGRDDERIYHLPFDQQYDSTVIDPSRGELYVATAPEAEERGFRRAWRWQGEGE